jgi:hypothetical protein
VDELVARIRLDGAVPTLVRAVEGDLQTPWNGLLGLAAGGLLEAAGLAAAPPAALAWFAKRLPDWADRFPSIRQATPLESPAHAFNDVLRGALDEQPITLVVDDAERIDRDSLLGLIGALRDFARRPLFLVLTVPSGSARASWTTLGASTDVDGRVVGSDAVSRRCAAFGAGPCQVRRSGLGHTRRVAIRGSVVAMELLGAVALGLDLAMIHGAWPEPLRTLDQTLPGDLPEGIVSAIRVGFRRLSPSAQRVLPVAAVLGAPLALDRVSRASGLAPDATIEALDELEWNRWLTLDGRGYGFAARIVREVIARDQLTEGQRQRIRAAAGEEV